MFKRIGQVEFSHHQVTLIESEAGWGSRVDEIIYFDTEQTAKAFVKEFNSYNTEAVAPDWYMVAEYKYIQ